MDEFERQWRSALSEMDALGIRTGRMLQQIEKHGALKTAKYYLQRRRQSDGFAELAARGRLELSMEALVVKGQFGVLFSDEEVNACFAQLCAAGYYGAATAQF